MATRSSGSLNDGRGADLAMWYRCLYEPRTGGAYDSQYRTAGIAGRTRRRGGCGAARRFLYAFDLIEVNGDDLRRDPPQVRKATLPSIGGKLPPGLPCHDTIEGDRG